jgi:hypothetical protein
MTDIHGNPMSAGEWLAWAAGCSEHEWLTQARAAGWPPGERPSFGLISQFGLRAQAVTTRASFARSMDRLRRQGRYIGQ